MKIKNSPDSRLRVIFITPCVNEGFFDTVKKGASDAAALLNVDCTFTGTEDVDIEEQLQIIDQAIESKYDGIVLSIIDPAAFDGAIARAVDRDIPIVAFNVNAKGRGDSRITEVCQDVYSAGKTLAREIENRISPNSSVLITFHSKGISALEDRYKGLLEVLGKKDLKHERLITGMDPGKAADIITEFLVNNSDFKVVIGTGQADTEGAGLAIDRFSEQTGFFIAGFDLSPEIIRLIKKGTIYCTIDQQPYIQGFYPVLQLSHLCRFGLKPVNIGSGAALITRENADVITGLSNKNYR